MEKAALFRRPSPSENDGRNLHCSIILYHATPKSMPPILQDFGMVAFLWTAWPFIPYSFFRSNLGHLNVSSAFCGGTMSGRMRSSMG